MTDQPQASKRKHVLATDGRLAIRDLQRTHGLELDEIAEQSGVGYQTVLNIERGRTYRSHPDTRSRLVLLWLEKALDLPRPC